MVAYRGANYNFDTFGQWTNAKAPTGITTHVNNSWVILATFWSGSNTGCTAATNFTQRETLASAGGNYGVDFQDLIQVTAGAVTSTGATFGVTPPNISSVMVAIETL